MTKQITVTIPDFLFNKIESHIKERKITRSELVQEYLLEEKAVKFSVRRHSLSYLISNNCNYKRCLA